MSSGYWRREDATRAAFVDGFFRTGDLATRSADGYYTLCGRKSDLIISGGFNIYPREIDEFLREQARDAFDPDAMEARCRTALASFKVPRRFVVVDALPRNAMGKIQKHLLSN